MTMQAALIKQHRLSQTMLRRLRAAWLNDGDYCGWAPSQTLAALQQRGLVGENGYLTTMGRDVAILVTEGK